jgi:hypothetical protein
MKILKENTELKEILPVSFLTDMISKGWEEVGYLKESSTAIREAYKDTSKIEALMQELMDAYLVFIGQIEMYLEDKENISADAAEESEPTPAVAKELPEAELKIEPINVDDVPEEDLVADIEATKEKEDTMTFSDKPLDDFVADMPIEPVAAHEEPREPFEFFVDFDEPDMSEPRLSDDDLYGHEDSEFEQNKLKAQLRG